MQWQAGQTLDSLTKPPITREHLREYAEASGDKNLIHLDDKFAQDAGFPSVIVHGMLSMAFMGDYVMANFPADKFSVTKLSSRFRKVTFPGDILECGGTFKKQLENGDWLVSLWIKNQNGELTTDGEAQVRSL